MAFDERTTQFDFQRRGRPVSGRTPGNDVGDIGGVAVELDGCEHPVEQLSGPPDKWQSLQVFLTSRRFADEHHGGLRIAVREYRRSRTGAQVAALETLQNLAQFRD